MYFCFCVVAAALGGFIFGYHTAVIAGAMLFIKEHFQLTSVAQGILVSSLLLGALLGAFVAGVLADRLGRRAVIFVAGAAIISGTILAAFAPTNGILLLGRILAGGGVGLYSVVTPMYLGEISPTQHRGTIISLYQLAITIGILAAYVVNYYLGRTGDWRAMFSWGLAPAILQLLALPFIVESPYWLLGKGSLEKARLVSRRIGVHIESSTPSLEQNGGWKALFARHARLVVFVGLALSCFQQITGINAVIYFAPQVFELVGLSSHESSLFATMGIGIINVLTTLIAVWLLDRLGRKTLLLIGLSGMALALCSISLAFFFHILAADKISIVAIFAYIAFFSMSLGPVTWVLITEIYPVSIRGKAMGIATLANWLCNYLVTLTFLDLASGLGTGGVFLLYASLSLLGLFFVYRCIPETKGKTFVEIQRLFKS